MDANVALANCNPLLIARGLVEGTSSVNKFGDNPDITSGTTEDVWDGSNTYTFATTADLTHLQMVADQAAMRGEHVEIQGLDINFEAVTQEVTLDAADTTTPVVLTTPLLRAFRMKVHANVVTDQNIELTNVGDTVTYAIIQAGKNQTLMAIYTVPAGKTAYMTQYFCDNVPTASKIPDSVEFLLWMADRGQNWEFQLKHERAIPRLGDGFIQTFNPYLKIPEKTDIKISAEVIGGPGDDGHPHAGFDLILIDNT